MEITISVSKNDRKLVWFFAMWLAVNSLAFGVAIVMTSL